MPKWGLAMKEGSVTSWLKNEGDKVNKGETFHVEMNPLTRASASRSISSCPSNCEYPVLFARSIIRVLGALPIFLENLRIIILTYEFELFSVFSRVICLARHKSSLNSCLLSRKTDLPQYK